MYYYMYIVVCNSENWIGIILLVADPEEIMK